jgi:creatinine amidohydrolase
MIYGTLTSPDLAEAVRDRVVIVPLGSVEQHGKHLPLLTDTLLVKGVADQVEAKLADRVLMTPTLWLGASDHHLDFPGTLSVPNSLYSEMIKSLARCLVQAGATRIFFLNGHGGNTVPVDHGLTELSNESDVYDRTWIVTGTYWVLADDAMSPDKHGMTSPQLTHACEYETSMMLHLHGPLVHQDRAIEDRPTLDSKYWGEGSKGLVSAYKRFGRQTASGSMGLPSAATAEKGESLIHAIGERVVAFVKEFATWPVLKGRAD